MRDDGGAIVCNCDNLVIGEELSIQFGNNGQAKVSVVEIEHGKEG